MLIDDLRKLLPPPKHPLETGEVPVWEVLRRAFGIDFPNEDTQFINFYGTGEINNWLTVWSPFASNRYQNILEQAPVALAGLRVLREQAPGDYPPLFYQPGGLFPWGQSVDGDTFCWRTTGECGAWRVGIVWRHDDCQETDDTMLGFLIHLLENRHEQAVFAHMPHFDQTAPRS